MHWVLSSKCLRLINEIFSYLAHCTYAWLYSLDQKFGEIGLCIIFLKHSHTATVSQTKPPFRVLCWWASISITFYSPLHDMLVSWLWHYGSLMDITKPWKWPLLIYQFLCRFTFSIVLWMSTPLNIDPAFLNYAITRPVLSFCSSQRNLCFGRRKRWVNRPTKLNFVLVGARSHGCVNLTLTWQYWKFLQ